MFYYIKDLPLPLTLNLLFLAWVLREGRMGGGGRGKVCSCLCVVRNGKCCFHLLRCFVLTLHTRTASSLFLYNAKGTTLTASARRKQNKAVTAYVVCNTYYLEKSVLLTATFFPKCMDYLFCPMDHVGSTFFRYISAHLPDYTMSHNRRQYSNVNLKSPKNHRS